MELRGDGLVLRPLTADDASAHKAGQDRAQIAAFEFPGLASLEQVTAAIERWQESWAQQGPVRDFGVWDTTGQVLVGNVEVRADDDETINLSYLVFPHFRHSGIATRACRVALSYAATAFEATIARIRVLDWNDASLAVARSLGAQQVGAEPSEAGGQFLVFELQLDDVDN